MQAQQRGSGIPPYVDTLVIGGGLSGLTAAASLARQGRSVLVLEKAQRLGGRAQTSFQDGFSFNLGPHALYRGGAASRILEELGVTYQGTPPPLDRGYIVRGRLFPMPLGPLDLIKSRLFGIRGRAAALRFFASLRRIDPAPLQDQPLDEWLEAEFPDDRLRQYIESLARLATYSNAPQDLSAGAAIEQLRLSLPGVYYLDGGWQTLVDGLRKVAEAAGAWIVTGAPATAIERDGDSWKVHARSADVTRARNVVVAGAPQTVIRLLSGVEAETLRAWADRSKPVRAACLDIALRRLPRPDRLFALGLEQPFYLSVHSAAARLAPPGGALIHTAKYLGPEEDGALEAEGQLQQFLDMIQPGWKQDLVHRRFLPNMTVYHGLVTARDGGLSGRPGPSLPGVPNFYVTGDWVGSEGMLADAAVASGRQAALLIEQTRTQRAAA